MNYFSKVYKIVNVCVEILPIKIINFAPAFCASTSFNNYLKNVNNRFLHCSNYDLVSVKESTKKSLPERPKLPPSPFLVYMKKEIKNAPDSLNYFDKVKHLSVKFKQLSEEEKVPFKNEYEKNLDIFRKNLAEYKASLSKEDVMELKKIKIEKKVKKQILQSRKRNKMEQLEMEKPKPVHNPFVIFLKEYAEKYPELPVKVRFKDGAKEWNKLSDDQKAAYKKIYQELIIGYQEQLLAWEERMIELGNEHLVRQTTLDKRKTSHKV